MDVTPDYHVLAQLAEYVDNVLLSLVFAEKVAKLKKRAATCMKSIDPGTNRFCPEDVQKAGKISVFRSVNFQGS